MVPWLRPTRPDFPPPETALADPNGLLAAGGDLSPDWLILAYRSGIFPWFNEQDPILWWSPDPRCVVDPAQVHISRSMQKLLRRNPFQITLDQQFPQVIQHCANCRAGNTWISPAMQAAYIQLFQQGLAHSVEVWQDNQLVGGLYGVAIGQLFFGESMFSLQPNASKVGFIGLAQHLNTHHFALIDCQLPNPHLHRLGAKDIPRRTFLNYIKHYIDQPPGATWTVNRLPVRA